MSSEWTPSLEGSLEARGRDSQRDSQRQNDKSRSTSAPNEKSPKNGGQDRRNSSGNGSDWHERGYGRGKDNRRDSRRPPEPSLAARNSVHSSSRRSQVNEKERSGFEAPLTDNLEFPDLEVAKQMTKPKLSKPLLTPAKLIEHNKAVLVASRPEPSHSAPSSPAGANSSSQTKKGLPVKEQTSGSTVHADAARAAGANSSSQTQEASPAKDADRAEPDKAVARHNAEDTATGASPTALLADTARVEKDEEVARNSAEDTNKGASVNAQVADTARVEKDEEVVRNKAENTVTGASANAQVADTVRVEKDEEVARNNVEDALKGVEDHSDILSKLVLDASEDAEQDESKSDRCDTPSARERLRSQSGADSDFKPDICRTPIENNSPQLKPVFDGNSPLRRPQMKPRVQNAAGPQRIQRQRSRADEYIEKVTVAKELARIKSCRSAGNILEEVQGRDGMISTFLSKAYVLYPLQSDEDRPDAHDAFRRLAAAYQNCIDNMPYNVVQADSISHAESLAAFRRAVQIAEEEKLVEEKLLTSCKHRLEPQDDDCTPKAEG